MSLLEIGDVVSKAGKAVDNNTESGEERQQQLSNRHAVDMASDNLLSKIIRPVTLIFLALMEAVIVIAAVNGVKIDWAITSQVGVLFGSAVGFYFDSKRRERIADKNASANMKLKETELKHAEKMERRQFREDRRERRRERK